MPVPLYDRSRPPDPLRIDTIQPLRLVSLTEPEITVAGWSTLVPVGSIATGFGVLIEASGEVLSTVIVTGVAENVLPNWSGLTLKVAV